MKHATIDIDRGLGIVLSATLLAACGIEPGAQTGGTTEAPGSEDTQGSDDATGTTTGGVEGTSSEGTGEDTTGSEDTTADTTGEPGEGRTFVLVHGSWMGAWAWERVVPELQAAGHQARVVELPAHGDDPGDPAGASLDGYRDVVLAAMDELGEPVVLVGHSMGGMVISAAAQAQPDDVDALVYVAGYLPQDGQSLLDLAYMDPGSIVGEHLIDNGDGTSSIELEAIGQVFCADCSAEDVMLLQDRHRPEPGAPLATPVTLGAAAFGSIPRFYVRTAEDVAVSPILQDQMIMGSPVDGETTLQTSHSPMLTQPQELAQALVEFVP